MLCVDRPRALKNVLLLCAAYLEPMSEGYGFCGIVPEDLLVYDGQTFRRHQGVSFNVTTCPGVNPLLQVCVQQKHMQPLYPCTNCFPCMQILTRARPPVIGYKLQKVNALRSAFSTTRLDNWCISSHSVVHESSPDLRACMQLRPSA